jgi:hypothetical protein
VAQTSWLRCEKINNLTQRRQAQRPAKSSCFVFFAPSTILSRLAGRDAFAHPAIISRFKTISAPLREMILAF